jgi:hypothetical protein
VNIVPRYRVVWFENRSLREMFFDTYAEAAAHAEAHARAFSTNGTLSEFLDIVLLPHLLASGRAKRDTAQAYGWLLGTLARRLGSTGVHDLRPLDFAAFLRDVRTERPAEFARQLALVRLICRLLGDGGWASVPAPDMRGRRHTRHVGDER